jgi:hypothetical protein
MRQPRLQARAESEYAMSPLAEFDLKLEQMIRELTLRIVVPRWTEFDTVWEAAIRVCDRYELGKTRRPIPGVDQSSSDATKPITSSPEPCATDAPAQTHPPIAA